MKIRKAMALALAGALVLTTVATGTTSEAAKKTKLKTKKVSIFVKGKKKISITGKKAKHKYTFTSKKKKIAKVSKTGVITGVKAGKTTITVKDTWKQKGKKKSKKLGTINVTVKKKATPKPKVTANVPQVTPQPPAPATQAPGGGDQPPVTTPDNGGDQLGDPTPTPSGNPDDPTPTPSGNPGDPTPTPPGNPDDPTPTPEIKAPTAEMKIAGSNIRAEESTTAEVTVSAGDVTDVTWTVDNTAVAAVQKDSSDAKKAVITGVAEGVAKVTAEVKVKVEGKDFTVKAEGTVHVAAKDALVINATIESAPTELEITKSAEMSVKVDVGEEEGVTIENILWEIIEGDAAVIDTASVEAGHVLVTADKLGDVTISVTVTAKKGDKTATDTKEVTIHVTPITYNIGKEISCTKKDWGAVTLDKEIVIKKTDLVEVLFSVKSGNADDKVSIKLSPRTLEEADNNAFRVQEIGVFETKSGGGAAAGTAEMVRNATHFTSNYATIKGVAAVFTGGANDDDSVVVTIEKVLVTPTDELALSIHAPGAVETNKTATVQAEIDENDFTSIEWVSSDETKATVEADPEDQRNGIVTGVAAGEVEITVKIKKGDNVIKEETVKMEVRFNYKGTPIDIDLTKGEAVDGGTVTKNEDGSVLIMNEPGAVVCALPYALKKGEKVKVIMEGHFGEKSGGFRLWTAPDPSTVGGNKVQAGSTVNYELNDGKPDFNLGNDFSVTAELEASVECVNLVIRMPGWSGSVTTLTDLTFTRFAVEYI